MSVDLSQTKELEGLENVSGQVDVQLETDGCQVELSGLFRITSHSELVARVEWVLWAHDLVQRWAMLDVYLPYAVCCVSEVWPWCHFAKQIAMDCQFESLWSEKLAVLYGSFDAHHSVH